MFNGILFWLLTMSSSLLSFGYSVLLLRFGFIMHLISVVLNIRCDFPGVVNLETPRLLPRIVQVFIGSNSSGVDLSKQFVPLVAPLALIMESLIVKSFYLQSIETYEACNCCKFPKSLIDCFSMFYYGKLCVGLGPITDTYYYSNKVYQFTVNKLESESEPRPWNLLIIGSGAGAFISL